MTVAYDPLKTIPLLVRALSLIIIVALVAFTPILRADGPHGVLVVVKGTIKIKSAKGGPVTRARVNMKVYPKDSILAEKDSRAKIVMSDKNILNISPETEVKIAEYEFDPNQNKKNVLLDVVKGKVRSTVEQKYEGENHFRVRTPTAVAGVRGTDFLAGFNPVSRASQIVTFEGLVEVGKPGPGGSLLNPVQVRPGQMLNAMAGKGLGRPVKLPTTQLNQMNNESQSDAGLGRPTARPETRPEAGDKSESTDRDSNSKQENSSEKQEDQKANNADNKKPANSGEANTKDNEQSASGGKSQSAGNTSGATARSPASATADGSMVSSGEAALPPGGNSSGGTMLDSRDLATGDAMTTPVGAPSTAGATLLPPPIFTPLPPPVQPICEACVDQIRATGPTHLNIRVINGQ